MLHPPVIEIQKLQSVLLYFFCSRSMLTPTILLPALFLRVIFGFFF